LPKQKDDGGIWLEKDDGGIWLAVVVLLSAIGVGGAILMSQPKKSTGTNGHTTMQPPKKSGCGCGMKKH
jgi:hypothetical protein